MNGGRMQLALRDLRDEFSRPQTLAALAGVAVVVGISGPFGTLEAFALLPRLAYWAVVVPLTYGAGFLGTRMVHPYLPKGPRALRIALAALGSAIAVALVLGVLNTGLGLRQSLRELALGFAAVYVICLVIETVGTVLQSHGAKDSPQTPALLARLPLEKRGTLLALSAEDHYTRVVTDKGQDLVLIRLSDAIAETAPIAGLQIHRSHWVSLAAVRAVARTGDGGAVTLRNGTTLPVARARIAELRAQGLLPRKGD